MQEVGGKRGKESCEQQDERFVGGCKQREEREEEREEGDLREAAGRWL
jgi:hypothetical protein